MNSSQARRDGRYFLLLGAALFLVVGLGVEHQSTTSMEDFKGLYYGARCLIQHHDPYRPEDVLEVYLREGGENAVATVRMGQQQAATVNVYPPAAFLFAAPFALLDWSAGKTLWMILTAFCVIFAAYLAWSLAADFEPLFSGIFAGILLADGFGALLSGNAAGIIGSLCVISVWCFLRHRWEAVGVLCLALSLAIKPHDAWLIWLCFLLGGTMHRRRAWQSLLCSVAFGLSAILWTMYVAPQWLQELRANLVLVAGPAGRDNPGPSSLSTHTAGMIVDLQTIFSVFKDEPHFYNPASYFVFAILLALCGLALVRAPASHSKMLLSLAALSALTQLPVYHRVYDARLLLLTLPAFALLWAEKNVKRWLAFTVTSAGIIFTGDVVLATLVWTTNKMRFSTANLHEKVRMILLTRPLPLLLLVIGCFYLAIGLRRSQPELKPAQTPPG